MTNYLIKLTVIGKGREVMYRYLKRIEDGDLIARFDNVSPETPTCAVIKNEDHHAKLHLHLLASRNPEAPKLMENLVVMHPELRFTLYYETPRGYGTLHGRQGRVESHAYKERQQRPDHQAVG